MTTQEAFKTLEKNGLKVIAVTGVVFNDLMEQKFERQKYMTKKDICEYLDISFPALEGRLRRHPVHFKVIKKGVRQKGEKTLYDKYSIKAYKLKLEREGRL